MSDDMPVKRLIFAFLALALIQPAAFAQTTWNDLAFGSSVDSVRKVLAKQGFTIEQTDKQYEWIAKPDWNLEVPGFHPSLVFHFRPSLSFSDAGRLQQVNLVFRDDRPGAHYYAVTFLEQQLKRKYGTPTTEAGVCDKAEITAFSDPGAIKCTATWKAKEEIVTLGWYCKDELTLVVTYEPLQNSGL